MKNSLCNSGKSTTRISRDEMLLQMTLALRQRGTCLRGTTGAIISRDGRPVSTGYNGPVTGAPHCSSEHCDVTEACKRSVHAEANAIVFSARNGISTEGCTLYSTVAPCYGCSQLIINCGIIRVVFMERYRDADGLANLQDNKIQVTKFELSNLYVD